MITIRDEVSHLAGLVFDDEELDCVLEIARAILGSKSQRRLSIRILRDILPTRPKRPLYYVNYKLIHLPMESRYVVEGLGSYLDLLIKEFLFEKEKKYSKASTHRNIEMLLTHADDDLKELLEKIQLFNKTAYVPSKHVYGSPNDPRHYFSNSDVAVLVLAAAKLGEELKKKSSFVRNFCQDLVLPGQKKLIGNHPRTDEDGKPFDFKNMLKHEIEIYRGRS